MDDIVPGDVLRLSGTGSYRDQNRPHNCVVAAEAKGGDLLLVPICSPTLGHDKTCPIAPAEATLTPNTGKSLIVYASFAAYYDAKLVPKKAYIARINQGDIEYLGKISQQLLAKIQNGIENSTETEPFIQKAYAHKVK